MLTWTSEKPTKPGWYWWRRGHADPARLIYHGAEWDRIVDFAGLDEPVTFISGHLIEGEWAGPLEPPDVSGEV
jgi:hypothetical protein